MTMMRVERSWVVTILLTCIPRGLPRADIALRGSANVYEGEEREPEEVIPEEHQENRFENLNGGQKRCGEEIGEAKSKARRIKLFEMGL